MATADDRDLAPPVKTRTARRRAPRDEGLKALMAFVTALDKMDARARAAAIRWLADRFGVRLP